jgi:hypothetical protein
MRGEIEVREKIKQIDRALTSGAALNDGAYTSLWSARDTLEWILEMKDTIFEGKVEKPTGEKV